MRLKVVRFKYGETYTLDQQEKIKNAVLKLPNQLEILFKEDGCLDYWCEWVIDTDILPPDVEYEVCSSQIDPRLVKAQSPDDQIENIGDHRAPAFNKLVNVVVPSNSLMEINSVKVLYDPCTDVLQSEYLNQGWRILAICPQPDQRRPDYILGRKE